MINFLEKNISNIKFNFLILKISVLFAILPLILINIYFENFFLKNVDKNNYYDSLYGNSEIGCSTINYIKPDILFIGDSVGYRAWDFNFFRKNTNLSIGTCFLQSFTEHSFEELIYFIKDKFTPKFIILSNSYRTFGIGPDNFEVVKRHKKYLKEIDESEYEKAFKLFFKKLKGEKFFNVLVPIEKNIQNYIRTENDEKFDEIIKIIIKQNLETSGIGSFKNAEETFEYYLQLFSKYENIQFFCDYLNKNNINLIYTDLPFSPPIYDLNIDIHLKNLKLVSDYFTKCINKNFYFADNKDFNSKNKYFVFTNFKNIDLKFFENIVENRDLNINTVKYYDYDHMNRYGAKVFTEYWLKKNKNIFKSENK